MRYCIAHNPLLLQPLGHWFTFIYRKCEHLAVGSLGRGLTDSRGSAVLLVALPSPFVPLLYHTLRGLSRGFLHFFSWLFPICVMVLRFLLTVKGTFPKLGTRSFLLTPLLYHNLGDLSRTFFKILNFFLEVMGRLVPPNQELRWSRTILPPFPSRLPRLSLLTSLTLYHTLRSLSRGFSEISEIF